MCGGRSPRAAEETGSVARLGGPVINDAQELD